MLSKFAGCKIILEKLIVLLCTHSEKSDNKFKKTIPLTMYDFYTETLKHC